MEQPTVTAPIESSSSTIDNNDIILVIPAHNDELTIPSVILKARPLVSKILVIDDGSKDRTSEVAQLAGAEIIRFQQSIGKSAATFEGLKKAHIHGM